MLALLLAVAVSAATPVPLASDPQVSALVAEALANSPDIGRSDAAARERFCSSLFVSIIDRFASNSAERRDARWKDSFHHLTRALNGLCPDRV